MKNLSIATGLVFSVLALAACTPKLGKANLESTITSTFDKQGIKLKGVTCPGDRELKAGDKFDCTGDLDEGGKVTIKVDQKEGKGHLLFDIAGSLVKEADVSAFLTKKNNTKVDAKCPKKMAILQKGDTLVCDITVGPDKGKVTITGEGEKVNFVAALEGKPPAPPVEGDEDKPAEGDTPNE